MAFELVETVEVGSGGASSIEFTSIPQDGTDLLLVLSLRTSGAHVGSAMVARFNGSTSTYTGVTLEGDGSSASSVTKSSYVWIDAGVTGANSTSGTFSNVQVYISNYTSSAPKSVSVDSVTENNGTEAYQALNANSWSGTSAITSIEFNSGETLQQYSTASLYKITAA